MEFDIKKQAFWLVLGALLVVYVAIYFVAIFPMSSDVETAKKESDRYVRTLEDTLADMRGRDEIAVPELVEKNKGYKADLQAELQRTIDFYLERDKTLEVPFGYGALDQAIDRYRQTPNDTNLGQVKSAMDFFFKNHFDDLALAFQGDRNARSKVFVGDIRYEIPKGGGGMFGGDTGKPIQDVVKGLIGEPSSIAGREDVDVLRKNFIISKAFLEILGQAPTVRLVQLEVTAKRGDGAVGLTPDLLRNPYLEVKGDPNSDPTSWKYSPAFVAKVQVHIRYEDVIALVTRILDGKAKVRLGGPDPHDVQLSTIIKSIRLAKELGDPKASETIVIPGEKLKDLDPRAREEMINQLKRDAVAGLTQPITLFADVYVLDFVTAERAAQVLSGTADASAGAPR